MLESLRPHRLRRSRGRRLTGSTAAAEAASRSAAWRRSAIIQPRASASKPPSSRARASPDQEAAHGGPIALLKTGDVITLNALTGELSVALTDAELAARKADWTGPRETQYATGALYKYAKLVGGARWGAVTHPGAKAEKHVYMDQ